MLYYVPLESLAERYTMQWSAPETGWLERNWRTLDLEYTRVDPIYPPIGRENAIQTGVVLDAIGRSHQTFGQIIQLLKLAEKGVVKSSDVVYFDDFWTPGMEALPYYFDQLKEGNRPRMYAFLHAQSVDEFDFTHPMRYWMRPMEVGFGQILDGIFVCCPTLKELVVLGGIAPENKVHVVGHPFSEEEVLERMPRLYQTWYQSGGKAPYANMMNRSGRDNTVVWSSRWDAEKNPKFFLSVAEEVINSGIIPDVQFVICTSSAKLRSNDESLRIALKEMCERYPNNITVKAGLTKEQYYQELTGAKIQFNCAYQDFVPITLQEASVAGCFPVYPYFRSMPESLLWQMEYLYEINDIGAAANKILHVLERDDLWTREEVEKRSWIHRRFNTSWLRMLIKMYPEMKFSSDMLRDPFTIENWIK